MPTPVVKIATHPYAATGVTVEWWTSVPNAVITLFTSVDGRRWMKLGVFTDVTTYTDVRRAPGKLGTWYKVIVNDTYGAECSTHNPGFDKRDIGLVRAVLGKERLLVKTGGIPQGLLLKRMDVGEKCTCHAGPAPASDSVCGKCYGTGVIGGYYQPVPYGVYIRNPGQDKSIHSGALGPTTSTKLVVRGIIGPEIHEGDVWIDARTNRRYYVTGGPTTEDFRGIPIIYKDIKMEEAANADIIFSLDVDYSLASAVGGGVYQLSQVNRVGSCRSSVSTSSSSAPSAVATFADLPATPVPGQQVLLEDWGWTVVWSGIKQAWVNTSGVVVTAEG